EAGSHDEHERGSGERQRATRDATHLALDVAALSAVDANGRRALGRSGRSQHQHSQRSELKSIEMTSHRLPPLGIPLRGSISVTGPPVNQPFVQVIWSD